MAIARDSGSSFPILNAATGTLSSLTSTAFSTSGETFIVITVSAINTSGTANWGNASLSWVGGAPTGAGSFNVGKSALSSGGGTVDEVVWIWTCAASQAITSKQITVTMGASSASANIQMSIDALTGTKANQTGAQTGGQASVSGSTISLNETLNGITTGSWIYAGAVSESGPLGPVTNTTEFTESTGSGPSYAAVGVNNTGTSGNINVGWTGSAAWSAAAALEVLAGVPAGIPFMSIFYAGP